MSNGYLTVSHISTKDLARIFNKIRISETSFWNGTPCWEWTGGHLRGYGYVSWQAKMILAHRLFYAWLVEPLPPYTNGGLELDHRCRNHPCVNPAHLELVTRRINTLRGVSRGAQNARKAHCPKGHPYRQDKNGHRRCHTCKNERRRQRYATDAEYRAQQNQACLATYHKKMQDPAWALKEQARKNAYKKAARKRALIATVSLDRKA